MATASTQQQSAVNESEFYCHCCNNGFKSTEAKCPTCKSEFVEEVEQTRPPPVTQSSTSTSTQTRQSGQTRRSAQEVLSDDEDEGGRRRRRRRNPDDDLGEMLGQYLVQLIAAREQLEDTENYTLPVIPPPPQFIDLMFRGSRSQRSEPLPPPLSFAGTLHNFVARLVEQLESSEGPPPADQNKIESLPTLTITQEHIDTEMECSICKEHFIINETCRCLPCTHVFHDDCIVQWLKIRDTCPTCRFSLNKGQVVNS